MGGISFCFNTMINLFPPHDPMNPLSYIKKLIMPLTKRWKRLLLYVQSDHSSIFVPLNLTKQFPQNCLRACQINPDLQLKNKVANKIHTRWDCFIKRTKIAVPVMFEIILIPSNTLHIGVGNVRVNDSIKKMKPTVTKTKPAVLWFNVNTPIWIF